MKAWTMGKHSKEIKIGIFAVVVLIATFIIINLLRGADLFGREIEVRGRFDNVEGLVASAPVMIRGYAAGRVNSVEYDVESDNFIVACSIDKRFRIPKDSKMVIFSTSIMGGKGVRIETGVSDVMVEDKCTISTGSDPDLISSLSDKVLPVLEGVNALIDSLKAISGNVNMITGEENRTYLKSSLSHLEKTLAAANGLLGSIEKDYSAKSDEIKSIVDNLESLSAKLAPLADSANDAVVSTGDAVDTLRKAIVDINKNVDKISEPLNTLLNDIDKLIIEVKNNPKKYLKISVF